MQHATEDNRGAFPYMHVLAETRVQRARVVPGVHQNPAAPHLDVVLVDEGVQVMDLIAAAVHGLGAVTQLCVWGGVGGGNQIGRGWGLGVCMPDWRMGVVRVGVVSAGFPDRGSRAVSKAACSDKVHSGLI